MAKGKYQEWLTPEGLHRLKVWARDGLTDEDIAHNMGISPKTLYEYKKKYSDISKALKENKELADAIVENALYTEAIHGNVTAAIFWLKNRQPAKWRENKETDAGTQLKKLDEVLNKIEGNI